MINKQDIKQLFEKMKKAGWNMDQPLVWGYFFKDSHQENLKRLAHQLEQEDFVIIDINQSYPDKLYWLQLEKIEQHSIITLNKRNQRFYQLAKDHHILKYDGMDVSPINYFD
jgi:hypothetical protein